MFRNGLLTAAEAAGPGDDFSGHSGRAGLVHRMAGKRAPAVAGNALCAWDSIDRNCGVPGGFKQLCQLGVGIIGEKFLRVVIYRPT